MHGQQLSKRVFKKQLNLEQHSNNFLRLKAEAVQLLNQIDLYRDHNKSNYNHIVQKISLELCNCTFQQQGQICLLLCQTGLNMNLSLLQIPLTQNFAQLVIYYINNLLQKDDPLTVQSHTTRQVYEGKFKVYKQKKPRLDNQQKLRDLLLIQRIDTVLAFAVEYLKQKKSQSKLSKKVIDNICRTKDLACRYLGNQEFQNYQRNLQVITQNNSKPSIVKKSKSTPIYRNYVIIDQKDADFMYQKINLREGNNKQKSLHRNSSRLQVQKSNLLHDAIESSNATEVQQQKRMLKGSQRLKSSLKRGSVLSITKRGSIQTKKSVQYIVRKSNHFINKQILDIKTGIARNQRKSRFQPISKFDVNMLKEQSLIYKHENEMNGSESFIGSKKQTFNLPSSDEQQQIVYNLAKEFYVFLEEKNRLWSLILKPNTTNNLVDTRLDYHAREKQFQLFFEDYPVFYCFKQFYQQKQEKNSEQYYLQKLGNMLVPYRNCRNELAFSNKGLQQSQNGQKNLFRVTLPQQLLLMGFIRKGITHFIVQCHFDRYSLQTCYESGIKRRLLTPNAIISFRIVYRYKLMNQDLYMTYELNKNMCVRKGSVICCSQKRNNNQNLNKTNEQKYKIVLTQSTLKQSDQAITFITFWQRQSEPVFQEMPRFKRKQTRSGTEIIMKQKINTGGYDQKRIKRVPLNKSSIRLHQNDVQKILQNNQSIRINSITKTNSKKQVASSEKLVSDQRILKKEKRRKKRINSGKELIETIRTEKGYKLVKKCITQNFNQITYSQYYGYLQRRANLIEYHRNKSDSFSIYNQNNYLKSRMTIHGKKNKIQANNTKILTFIKRLKDDTSLIGYLVGSIKLLVKDKNKYVFMEVYWQSMQKYFLFVLSQDIFQKIIQIQLDHFEKHSFSALIEKEQSKKRDKRTSFVNSLIRHRVKQNNGLNKSNESRINVLKIPKVISIEKDSQYNVKPQTLHKFKDTNKNVSSNCRSNNFWPGEKTTESYSFSSFGNMKESQRLQFKREVAAYIKNKLIRYMQFSWKNYNLVLQLRHPNLEDSLIEINGKELAVKNIHFAKKKHQSAKNKQPQQFEVSATELLVIRYRQSSLANLKFYTCQGLNKIYLEHLFIKNSDDLFGFYKSNICLRQIDNNKARIDTFYSSQNGFFQQSGKEQQLLPVSQPVLRHFISKYSTNKDEQKRYKYSQIINFAKKCSLNFDFIEKKRKKISKDLFVIPNRYPHLNLKHFMLTVQITFEQIEIRDLNGYRLIGFQKQKLLIYFPYLYKLTKTQLKKLLVQRLLKDPDLIRLCQTK